MGQGGHEPYGESVSISNEDYLLLVNKLNEFADNTFTFGESILKRMEEVSFVKTTADKLAKKGEEISTSLFKRTRDSISSIQHSTNSSSRVSALKEKAGALGGKLWGVRHLSLLIPNLPLVLR